MTEITEYKEYLSDHEDEWELLDAMCRITISRFYRDRRVFDCLRTELIPNLAANAGMRGEETIHCWSAGCGSGEEAYTMNILWREFNKSHSPGAPDLRITATDANRDMLERCRSGKYSYSSVRDLPPELIRAAFDRTKNEYVIRNQFKKGIEIIEQDIRLQAPAKTFQVIMCRNLVFTYYEKDLQEEILRTLNQRLAAGGYLVTGIHEELPVQPDDLAAMERCPCIFEKVGSSGR
jgi:chemotaxis protein methyltransferase CheR